MDQPTVATGPGGTYAESSVWVTWNQNVYNNGVVYIRVAGASVSGIGLSNVGASVPWPAQPATFNTTTFPQYAIESDIAVGPLGQVLCTFQSVWRLTSEIYVGYDADGLGTNGFDTPRIIKYSNVNTDLKIAAHNVIGITIEPGLAWDRRSGPNGRVYLVYTTRPTQSESDFDTDIYTSYSTDNGASWSISKLVNNDSSGKSQFLPRIAVDQSTGNLAVSWYDCRGDAANVKSQYYVAMSTDGGVNFNNIRVQSAQSNGPSSGNDNQYGDYAGLDFSGGLLGVAWADNNITSGDNIDAPKVDIYTSIIRY